jgi:hypothetical protein
MEFTRLDPNRDYPSPWLSILPVLDTADFGSGRLPSRFLEEGVTFANAGRTAIRLIVEHLSVPGDVLLPAFHCPSMVTPILEAGRTPRFYHLTEMLAPDLEDVEAKLSSGQVAAMLLPHYFGFPQTTIGALTDSLHQRGIVLIEDCAHAFFGSLSGIIAVNTGTIIDWSLQPVSLKAELKSVYDLVQEAVEAGRWPCLKSVFLNRSLPAYGARSVPRPSTHQSAPRMPYPCHTALWSSRWILRRQDHQRVALRRRVHFERWLSKLAGLNSARPLYNQLPEQVVPYMFPLILECPASDFPPLKRAGIPIWRWDELARSDCQVSQRYGLTLLQLPCHQTLSNADIDWMADTIRAVVD